MVGEAWPTVHHKKGGIADVVRPLRPCSGLDVYVGEGTGEGPAVLVGLVARWSRCSLVSLRRGGPRRPLYDLVHVDRGASTQIRNIHSIGDADEPARLLPQRHQRPRSRCAADQRDERAAPHSITSSAVASSVFG